MHAESLASLFLAQRRALAWTAALEAVVGEHLAAARAAWPELPLAPALFVAHLARHAPPDASPEEVCTALRTLNAPDLYLEAGCAHGLPAALLAFERRYLDNLAAILGGAGMELEFVDELRQLVRAKLLVAADGEPPKIAEYAGRGALLMWLRIAAGRIALRLREQQQGRREVADDVAERVLTDKPDPETALLKSRYQAEFKQAIEASLAALSAEQRNLLRLHYIDGLSIDRLGALFSVHRATAARWLQTARAALFEETQKRLEATLQLQSSEFPSLARALQSQLDLSISKLLG